MCYYLGQVGVIIWAKVCLAYVYRGFRRFLDTQSSFCAFVALLAGIYGLFVSEIVSQNVFLNFLVLSLMWRISVFSIAKTL